MKSDLQSRLIDFVSLCILVKKSLISNFEGDYLGKQLFRSATSAALNYGEAQSAESTRDFIHKQSIILKELRESYINSQIIENNSLSKDNVLINRMIEENNQLISIFVVSIKNSKKKLNKRENF